MIVVHILLQTNLSFNDMHNKCILYTYTKANIANDKLTFWTLRLNNIINNIKKLKSLLIKCMNMIVTILLFLKNILQTILFDSST